MTAFERIKSGIDDLDKAFDNIRMGDNVVWQLSKLEDFSYFVKPFIKQAIADHRNIIYIRFADHPALLDPDEHVKIYRLDPNVGFESFTVAVRKIITKESWDAFYVFDSLSELQVAWSSDLMMGNFFRVTCPYLFDLDTVAYFPVIRGRHSFAAIAKIRDTTQLLIDVTSDDEQMYIHPLKVWNRYSPTMFLAHSFDPKTSKVSTLSDGVEMSRYYACVNSENSGGNNDELNMDSWDRFFLEAKMNFRQGELCDDDCTKMCNMMMTKDPRMRQMVREYFDPQDYFTVRNNMIGTGLIGGKSCGMLLARKIVEKRLPQYSGFMEPHDSFYIGADVFYTYLVDNGLWKLRINQQSGDGFINAAPALQEGILNGVFPEDIRQGFTNLLDYYGQTPIIVRSSSILEDGFGNAFAGKYESVFCANSGEFDERLKEFEDAVRTVYASSLDRSALEYRQRNGLDTHEEQMCLLVQRVSGSLYDDNTFMPTAAGVGYSHSAYCWDKGMDPDAGMLRLVMGLGTKAVDRTGEDYPRIVNLDKPLVTTAKSVAEKHKYSQRYVNLIDLNGRKFSERKCLDMAGVMSDAAKRAVFEHDREAEQRLRERGRRDQVLFASCQGLVENKDFVALMQSILKTLQGSYGYPVDIEYTINVGKDGRFVVNLLQCRPLQSLSGAGSVEFPSLPDCNVLFKLDNSSMGSSRQTQIDYLLIVDPKLYYVCPYAKKPDVAHLVGNINAKLAESGARCLLMAPGRIGTSSPELGVPVTFADISNLEGICEVAYSEEGYRPELSYGSHMFQDLVEANIFYGAIFEVGGKLGYSVQLIDEMVANGVASDEDLEEYDAASDDPDLKGIIRLVKTSGSGLTLWHDMMSNRSVCGIAEGYGIAEG